MSIGKVPLKCIVTLQNGSQTHSQESSGKVPLECIVTLQNGSQIHSQESSGKVPLECIVTLQNGSQILPKHHGKWQGPIGMHCDAPKWVPDPFPRVKQQGPIGMHCDAPKLVPDPFPSFKADAALEARFVHNVTWMLPLNVFIA